MGEEQGGVGFAEVEFDAPGMGDLGLRYFVSSAYIGARVVWDCKGMRLIRDADQFNANVAEFQQARSAVENYGHECR